MASNLKIVSTNIGRTATLVASSESGVFTADNMQLDSKTLIWRSTGTTESITATFTSASVSCVSLPICNLTSTATMRVRVYTLSGDVVDVLDTGNILCCEYTTINKIDFTDGALNSNTFSYGGGTYATLFFTETVGEKVVIDIIDTANTNGYIESCSLVIGSAWTPTLNADYGATWLLNDTSKHSRNDSGDLMTARGARYRSLSFSMGQMDASDRAEFMEILIRNGLSINLFISIFPESIDTQEKQMYQIFGKLTKLQGLTRFVYGLDKSSIQIQEI